MLGYIWVLTFSLTVNEGVSMKTSFNINPRYFTCVQNDSINEFNWILHYNLKKNPSCHHYYSWLSFSVPDQFSFGQSFFVLIANAIRRKRKKRALKRAAKLNGKLRSTERTNAEINIMKCAANKLGSNARCWKESSFFYFQ